MIFFFLEKNEIFRIFDPLDQFWNVVFGKTLKFIKNQQKWAWKMDKITDNLLQFLEFSFFSTKKKFLSVNYYCKHRKIVESDIAVGKDKNSKVRPPPDPNP